MLAAVAYKVAIKDAGIEAEIDTINGHVDHR
jgi:hypothetical protein